MLAPHQVVYWLDEHGTWFRATVLKVRPRAVRILLRPVEGNDLMRWVKFHELDW